MVKEAKSLYETTAGYMRTGVALAALGLAAFAPGLTSNKAYAQEKPRIIIGSAEVLPGESTTFDLYLDMRDNKEPIGTIFQGVKYSRALEIPSVGEDRLGRSIADCALASYFASPEEGSWKHSKRITNRESESELEMFLLGQDGAVADSSQKIGECSITASIPGNYPLVCGRTTLTGPDGTIPTDDCVPGKIVVLGDTPTPAPTPPYTPTPVQLPGDCNDDGTVEIPEAVAAVSISVGSMDMDACPSADADKNGEVEITDLITVVRNML